MPERLAPSPLASFRRNFRLQDCDREARDLGSKRWTAQPTLQGHNTSSSRHAFFGNPQSISGCPVQLFWAFKTLAVAQVAKAAPASGTSLNHHRHMTPQGQQHRQALQRPPSSPSLSLLVAFDGTRQASAVDPAPLTADFPLFGNSCSRLICHLDFLPSSINRKTTINM